MTRTIARQNGRQGVTAFAVAPGYVDTPFNKPFADKFGVEVAARDTGSGRSRAAAGRRQHPVLPRVRARPPRDRHDDRRQRRQLRALTRAERAARHELVTGRDVFSATMEANREPDAVATPLLEARGLSRSFRGLQALVDYELRLPPLTIHGVIGPNGAGKTTLFHLLSGFLRPSSGSIAFEGRDITGSAAFKVSRMGIGRTFQNIRLFGELSVLDNVKIALQRHSSDRSSERSSPAHRSGAASVSSMPARSSCSSCSTSPASAIERHATCRTGTSGGSRSPARWARGPRSSCSTSRMPG